MAKLLEVSKKIKDLYFVTPYYAIQNNEGGYYPARTKKKHGSDLTISENIIAASLTGAISIGAYTTSRDDKCKWICIDLDEPRLKKNPDSLLFQFQLKARTYVILEKCRNFGLSPYVEKSGRKGMHVFLFFSPHIPAKKAYAIAQYLGGEGMNTDCFPRQPSLKNLKYGNLVRICNNVHRATGNKSFWVDPQNGFKEYEDQNEYILSIKTLPESSIDDIYLEAKKTLPQKKKKQSKPVVFKKIPPIKVSIDAPGERNKKQWVFTRNCLNADLEIDEAKELGKIWLKKYESNYTTPFDEAFRYLEMCIEREYKLEGKI